MKRVLPSRRRCHASDGLMPFAASLSEPGSSDFMGWRILIIQPTSAPEDAGIRPLGGWIRYGKGRPSVGLPMCCGS